MKKTVANLISIFLLSLVVNSFSLCLAEQNFSGADAIVYAQKFLEKHLVARYDLNNIEISYIRPISDVRLPDGKISCSIDTNEMTCIGKYYTLPLTLSVNEKAQKTLYINLKVKTYENIVVAARTLKMHQLLDKEDLTMARIEVSNNADYFKNISDLVGMKTSLYIQAGKPINFDNIVKTPLVAKNKQIKVTGRIGDIEATIYGTALETGFINDVIRIQNPSTQKIISAKIIDKDNAELVF